MKAEHPLLVETRKRLEKLPPAVLEGVARTYARKVSDDGLHVVKEDGSRVPIPPLLTPVLPDPDAARAAKVLLACVIRTARAILSAPDPAKFKLHLFTGLTGLEKELVRGKWEETERVASSRVDFLRGTDGKLNALEVNATIPAMQGYSDIVAAGFVREVGPALGATPEAVTAALAMLPSNVDDLRKSLLAQAEETGAGKPGKWALLARENDSQSGELAWIAARWREKGIDARCVTPKSFFSEGPWDLVYRHLFARRLEPGSPLEAVYREARKNAMWNPVNAHLEIKGMLALVHEAAHSVEAAKLYGHPGEELRVVREVLPWTALLLPGGARGIEGEDLGDLPAYAIANGDRVILKRSWDYGGRSVFLKEDLDSDSETGPTRIAAATGAQIETWKDLVRFAATDPAGDWIVQERIRPMRRRHLRVVDGRAEWGELVTDVSAFTGAGASFAPGGLTARAAGGAVVNIVSGGGMAPIIPEPALRLLLGKK